MKGIFLLTLVCALMLPGWVEAQSEDELKCTEADLSAKIGGACSITGGSGPRT